MAKRTLSKRVLLFYLFISPNYLLPERYVEIKICFKCFKLEQLKTLECLKIKILVVFALFFPNPIALKIKEKWA